MKRTIIIAITLILTAFLFTSCQKAKEPEGKKEVQVQQAQKEEVTQQSEEAKPEVQPLQQQPSVTTETKEEKKEKPTEPKSSPLTEAEQKAFSKWRDKWDGKSPSYLNEKAAVKYLGILIKGKEDSAIKWYSDNALLNSGTFEDDVCELFSYLANSRNVDAYKIAVEVSENPETWRNVLVCVLRAMKNYDTKEAIPLAKKFLTYEFPRKNIPGYEEYAKRLETDYKLEAAGTLMALGDVDAALIALDELAKEGNTYAIPYLFKKHGELWDKRGVEIIKRAVDYPQLQIRAEAALFLAEIGIEKDKAEEVALKIITQLKDKKREDYGFTVIGGPSNPKWVLLPEYKGKNLKELKEFYYADSRACTYALQALEKGKSKKAIPLLNQIKGNYSKLDSWVCWENDVDKTLKEISGQGGGK